MHIVLAGQPGLAAKLSETKMTQLRQRVSNIIRLEPFRHEEIINYVQHRLRAAGHDGPCIFSADALDMIARLSQGIPRNINSLCFQALSIGFATQTKQIGGEILREVAADLDFAPRRTNRASTQHPNAWLGSNLKPPPSVGRAEPRTWEIPSTRRPPHSSKSKWLTAIACFAIVPISVVALSDSKLGLSHTLPGQASAKMINAVLSSRDPNADFVPAWPDRLKAPPPPQPPTETANTASATSPSENQDNPSLQSGGKANAILENPDYAKSTKGVRNRPAAATAEAIDGHRGAVGHYQTGDYSVPTRVQVLHSETLFQFAFELYGHANWTIIEAICAANPQIHGPYSVLSPGQSIQLPRDLVTVTANYRSHAAVSHSR